MNDDYKELKNILHNDLKITKAEIHNKIMDAISDIVYKEVDKALHDKAYIEDLVKGYISAEIRRDDYQRRSYLHCALDEIYHKIDTVIHEEVCNRLVIELKESDNEED